MGRVLVDGRALDASRLDRLREDTVWVDPAIQIWNRSLLANLTYGARGSNGEDFDGDDLAVPRVLDAADLYGVLERLPDGLQTSLGEDGGLLSGGEGQRVRLGRGLMRSAARLVILDEPFRGLDREKRRQLLDRVRKSFEGATLLCVTHDVGETRSFERVLVIDGGRIAEDGAPADLERDPDSQYRTVLDAEEEVRVDMWSSSVWRRMRIRSGRLGETGADNGDDGRDDRARVEKGESP